MAKPRESKENSSRPAGNVFGKLLELIAIAMLIVIVIVIAIGYFLKPKQRSDDAILPDKGAITIQLFGGCGRGNEVMKIADNLRELGVDVVEQGKDIGSIYPETIIIDRRGNKGKADSLARIFGLGKDRIILQIFDLSVDATVVIGLDYPKIAKKLQGKM